MLDLKSPMLRLTGRSAAGGLPTRCYDRLESYGSRRNSAWVATRGLSESNNVDKPDGSPVTEHPDNQGLSDELPPGNHPLEVAARRGVGPLSPLGREVWHGQTRPCVSCGQLVLRDREECDHCGQDLSEEMLEKMRALAGPWDVYEHVRPFPGVRLKRVIRQIHRGVLTETSIVRGPATELQWRFAVETPGLCRYFKRCWNCYEEVSLSDTYCAACLSHLLFEKLTSKATQAPRTTKDLFEAREPTTTAEPPAKSVPKLEELSEALDNAEPHAKDLQGDAPPRPGRTGTTWIVVAMVAAALLVLVWVSKLRSKDADPSTSSLQGMVVPTQVSDY